MRILKCGKIRNRLLEGLTEATLGVLVSLSASAAIPAPAADLERYGASPDLPLPHKSMLPTVKIAPARWPEAVRPTPAQ